MLNFDLLHGPVHDGSDRYFIACPPESIPFYPHLTKYTLGSNMGRIVEHLVQDGVVTYSEQNLRILLNHWFTHLFPSPLLPTIFIKIPSNSPSHLPWWRCFFPCPRRSTLRSHLTIAASIFCSNSWLRTWRLTRIDWPFWKVKVYLRVGFPTGKTLGVFLKKNCDSTKRNARKISENGTINPPPSLAPGLTVFALVRRCGGPRLLRGRCASGKRPKRSGSPKAFRRSTRSSGGSSSGGDSLNSGGLEEKKTRSIRNWNGGFIFFANPNNALLEGKSLKIPVALLDHPINL